MSRVLTLAAGRRAKLVVLAAALVVLAVAGSFAGRFESERAYAEGTMVIRTTFRTATGTVRLTDALALAPGARGHDIGLESPHAIVRLLEGLEGEVAMVLEFAPRPEYGLVVPQLAERDGGLVTVGGSATLVLEGAGSARVELRMREGESRGYALRHSSGMRAPHAVRPLAVPEALEDTIAAWRSWAEIHDAYDGAYRAQVLRSALVIQALTFQPSGAVIAAPTTSLPEIPGGDSNWDYRFAWLRDASLVGQALWTASCSDEACRYFHWMTRAAIGCREDPHVQIMFGVEGERDLSEHTLDHLRGFRDSRPVRIGNEAWKQKQLDVLGEVVDVAHLVRDEAEPDPLTRDFVCGLVERAAEQWQDPDAGIWEGREGERDYLTSKVMCWVALDRGVKLAPWLGERARPEDWSIARDQVRAAILERGWSESAGAYTGAFDSDHLDAGVLLMPLIGFLPMSDERMRRTVEVVERELSSEGLVRRWSGAEDGAFVLASYWLADCLARAGEVERACEVFERVSGCANDVALLAEEVEPASLEMIGNFPQAISHVGLINAARSIHEAERARGQVERRA
jgi:GH15 family glucan-1,4-alpha-glucosidase